VRSLPLAIVLVACGRGAVRPADGGLIADAAVAFVRADPKREELWTRAKGGDPGDLARLADAEGESGLAERGGADPASRMTALRAMAFAPDPGAFAGLPFLAEAAGGGDDAQAGAALDSAIDLAARPRRAIDPEDAAEMKAGCDALLALAKDPKGPRSRRVNAIRALRMLAERGCVDPAALPTDLDAR
jgi:hypothetical protein